jgi:hypothetical protein
MNISTDFSFPRLYECEILAEIPGGTPLRHYYYPGATTAGGRDGVSVRVVPQDGAAWSATFAFGRHGRALPTRVLSLPDPTRVCIVSDGAGYIVDVADPLSWEPVEAVPITDVRSIPHLGLVVFASLTELVAYGAEGRTWGTRRLAWDGLRVTQVTDSRIIGEYWDSASGTMESFEVDLATGHERGGINL